MSISVKSLTFLLIFLVLCDSPSIWARKNTTFLSDTSYQIKKVVIDAGHGGKDSGCLGSKSQEKNITLKIALAVGKKIKSAYPHVEVVYTRDKDVFIPLDERANIANRHKADIFISIHCNYVPAASKHHGSETYVLGLNRTRENLEIAKRENAAVFLEDSYQKRYKGYDHNKAELDILVSAVQSSYLERSMLLAGLVEKHLVSDAERKSHGVKQAGFLVLRETSMPSILVETGFLSNKNEESFLSSQDGQNQEAQAIFEAFEDYKNSVEKGTVYSVAPIKTKTKVDTTATEDEPKEKKTTAPNVVLVSEKVKEKSKAKVAENQITKKGELTDKKVNIKPVAAEKIVAKKQKSVVFKVQIARSPTKLVINDDKWKLINELEIVEEPKEYIYRADGFETYEDASAICSKLKNAGFKDAFIVAFEGKKKLDIQEAIKKSKQ